MPTASSGGVIIAGRYLTPARFLRTVTGAVIVVLANVVLLVYVVSGVTHSALPLGELALRSPSSTAPPLSTSASVVATSQTTEPAPRPPVPDPHPVTTDPPRLSPPSTSSPRTNVPIAPAPPRTTSPPPPSTSPPSPTTAAPSTGERPDAVVAVGDPAVNIAPDPDFLDDCGSTTYDDTPRCVGPVVSAIDNARADEGLGAMELPTNWTDLTPAQQLFVATNLERTVRGLPPVSALATTLDAQAGQSALSGSDPAPPPGFPSTWWVGNWAGALGNPLEALYYWMYDDGLGSPNVACTPSNLSGCWGHRQNILSQQACTPCVAGAAWGTATVGTTSATEVISGIDAAVSADFTWTQELPSLSG